MCVRVNLQVAIYEQANKEVFALIESTQSQYSGLGTKRSAGHDNVVKLGVGATCDKMVRNNKGELYGCICVRPNNSSTLQTIRY